MVKACKVNYGYEVGKENMHLQVLEQTIRCCCLIISHLIAAKLHKYCQSRMFKSNQYASTEASVQYLSCLFVQEYV